MYFISFLLSNLLNLALTLLCSSSPVIDLFFYFWLLKLMLNSFSFLPYLLSYLFFFLCYWGSDLTSHKVVLYSASFLELLTQCQELSPDALLFQLSLKVTFCCLLAYWLMVWRPAAFKFKQFHCRKKKRDKWYLCLILDWRFYPLLYKSECT